MDNGNFQNPLTLELFLYAKRKNEPLSIRETQRELGIHSASTVHWHFNKLVEKGYLEKLKDNTYRVTDYAKQMNSFNVPVNFSFLLVKGKLINRAVFQVAFLIFTIFFALILLKINKDATLIFFFLAWIIELSFTLRMFLALQKRKIQEK